MELDINKVLENYKQKLAEVSQRVILLEVENEQLKIELSDVKQSLKEKQV